jgi:predicted nucleic acid-binding protein
MSEVVVCDASALVALLVDSGSDGAWATRQVRGVQLAAPDLLPYETANILRRHELADLVSADVAAQAHADLQDLAIELWPYELLADRAWALRGNLSVYDASYAALAEFLRTTLITLDRKIARAPGVRCPIAAP